MRVLHLCWTYPSQWFPAEGAYLRNMVEPLSGAELQVMVVTPMPYVPKLLGQLIGRGRRSAQLPSRYEFEGIQVLVPRYLRLPHALIGEMLPKILASSVAAAVEQRPDIVHAHYAYPFGVAALHLRSKWRVPVVLTMHGSDANVDPYQSAAGRKRFIDAVQGADHVLAVSHNITKQTQALTGRVVQYWPIGVDIERFRRRTGDRSQLRSQLGLPPDKKVLLFVGAMCKAKGVNLIPALLDRLAPDVHAVLVGEGPLSEMVRTNPRCTWVPPVANSRIGDYLTAADVMLLPSETEGTPTVLVEAGVARLPVVATAVGGVPELLADGRGLITTPGDLDALVNAVSMTLADPKASAERADRLYAHVASDYDCARNGQRLAQLYTQLAAGVAFEGASAARNQRTLSWDRAS